MGATEDVMRQLNQAVESIRIAMRRAKSGNNMSATAELDIARSLIEAAKETINKAETATAEKKAK
jgi:hypothetical protein